MSVTDGSSQPGGRGGGRGKRRGRGSEYEMKWKLSDAPDLARKNIKPTSLDSLTGANTTHTLSSSPLCPFFRFTSVNLTFVKPQTNCCASTSRSLETGEGPRHGVRSRTHVADRHAAFFTGFATHGRGRSHVAHAISVASVALVAAADGHFASARLFSTIAQSLWVSDVLQPLLRQSAVYLALPHPTQPLVLGTAADDIPSLQRAGHAITASRGRLLVPSTAPATPAHATLTASHPTLTAAAATAAVALSSVSVVVALQIKLDLV
jgi:hypothetical protein